jgi:tRNA-Thr(GGU) m(6)t(6)A37 methyltransferase TsaA
MTAKGTRPPRPSERMRGYRRPGLAVGEQRLPFDLAPSLALTLAPVAVVRSPYRWRDQAPRQASAGEAVTAVVVFKPGMQNALHCLHGFEYCWLVTWLHRSKGWRDQIVPPRDTVKRGVFATRSPDRPNPIGISAVRLLAVVGCRVRVRGIDLLDGTPVLDLKPYIPAYDAFPHAAAGWVDCLTEPGPDHRRR